VSWTWKITSGTLLNQNNIPVGHGYAGHGEGLNNSNFCNVPDVGPLPTGKYTIGPHQDNPHVGLFAMRLTPDPANQMFGRAGFFIHGDNPEMNHTASDGCIILAHPIRQDIANSADDDLIVEV
jgi:hypothetical protein